MNYTSIRNCNGLKDNSLTISYLSEARLGFQPDHALYFTAAVVSNLAVVEQHASKELCQTH